MQQGLYNEEEDLYLQMMEEVDDYAFILLDQNGIITNWNKGAQKIKQYTEQEAIGMYFGNFYLPEDRANKLPEMLLNMARTEGKAVYEGWRVRKDHTQFWGSITLTALHNEQGEVTGFLKITRDLTERKASEEQIIAFNKRLQQNNEALKKSEALYHKMISEVNDYAIILLNESGDILNWNAGAEKIKGYAASEIVGKNFREFYLPADQESKLPEILMEKATRTGKAILEGWRVRKDRSTFWGSIVLTALHGEDGSVIGFSKVTRDLTDKKLKEDQLINIATELRESNEALRKSEERYHKMIGEVQDYAIILLNEKGEIQNWNIGAERIKGYKASEVIGKNFRLFYRQEDQVAGLPQRLITQAATEGKALHEGWRVRKDQTVFWGSVVITALHADDGSIIGFSKVTRDLTERKASEDKIQTYLSKLESQNQELKQFAYIASHDLQEPLRKVRTFVEIIETNIAANKPVDKYFEKINASIDRMSEQIKGILNFSRMSQDAPEMVDTDLNRILKDTLGDFELLIHEKNATIVTHPLPVIKGSPLQVNQLFNNLIGNALKFSDKEPRIEISPRIVKRSDIPGIPDYLGEGQYVQIRFSDNGIGFEQQYENQIYTIFKRLHARTEYPGTGIGLALCKRIMENHHGFITATGEPGKGADFYVYFPL